MVRSSRLGFEKMLTDCAFKIIVGGVVISLLLLLFLDELFCSYSLHGLSYSLQKFLKRSKSLVHF